jgi:hypothetical protein
LRSNERPALVVAKRGAGFVELERTQTRSMEIALFAFLYGDLAIHSF